MTTAPLATRTDAPAVRTTTAGRLAIAAGIVGLLVGVQTLVTPNMVPANQYSAPLTPALATVEAIVLALHHLALVPLLALLPRVAAPGMLGRVGGAIASIGMVGLAISELTVIAVAGEIGTTPTTDAVVNGFSITSLVLGIGEVLLGIAVVRAAVWRGATRPLMLIPGIWLFVPMIPAQIVGAPWSMLALIVWSLLYVPLGVAVMRRVE